MAKNEDGEFELILGNKQLLSVFFLVVLLLGLSFLMGYVVGKDSAPVLNAEQPPAPVSSAPRPDPVAIPVPVSTPKPVDPGPIQTAPQTVAEPVPVPEPKQVAKAEPPPKPEPVKKVKEPKPEPKAKAKPEPPKPEPKQVAKNTKQPPVASAPAKGRSYLQLSATSKDEAEAMTDLLRSRGFAAIAAQIPEQPTRYRVLVGPVAESDLAKTKADLKAKSFPADQAIRRVF